MYRIDDLIDIVARLRDPEHGCPWDRVQTFRTIVPHTIEEAYEVADAIEREHLTDLVDELGDLLFQVVFLAQIGRESAAFRFEDVVDAIIDKMIRRHPHVFGDAQVADAAEQSEIWEEIKAAERSQDTGMESRLDNITLALPALTRAVALQRRAARCGFDWTHPHEVLDKIAEEFEELQETMRLDDRDGIHDELGDLLFSVVNLARHLGIDSESAVRAANQKFERRFRALERHADTHGISIEKAAPVTLDQIWSAIKAEEC